MLFVIAQFNKLIRYIYPTHTTHSYASQIQWLLSARCGYRHFSDYVGIFRHAVPATACPIHSRGERIVTNGSADFVFIKTSTSGKRVR